MLFIDNETQRQVLKIEDCINIQDQAFRGLPTGAAIHRPRIDLYVPNEREDAYWRFGTMEGASKALGVFAIRMKSDVLTWPRDEAGNWTEEKYCVEPGTWCGLVWLFSTHNGEPLAILNDGIIQHMRVGAGAGLGAKYLAREDAHVVGMLGSGGMAHTSLMAFCAVRDIHRCHVYSPTKAHREAYAEEMSKELGIEVIAVDDARSAVQGADIVCIATDAMERVLDGAWLEPGMHVTNPGTGMGEDVVQRAGVIIRQGIGTWRPETGDHPQAWRGYVGGSPEEIARLPGPKAGYLVRGEYPSFTDLVNGEAPGRTSPEQITLYLDMGNQGLQFAAAGWLVYHKCREEGLGREIPTEWFLQDIRD